VALRNLGANDFDPQLFKIVQLGNAFAIFCADTNNDGVKDVTFITDSKGLVMYKNTGSITFQLSRSVPLEVSPADGRVVDLNKDGFYDLVTCNTLTASIGITFGKANGPFGNTQFFSAGATPVDIALEDFNSDSYLDIAYSNNIDDSAFFKVGVILSDGLGGFLPPVSVAGRLSNWIAAGDFNQDGNKDIVIQGYYYLGNGSGGFIESTYPYEQSYKDDAAVADFNKDGFPDLVISNLNFLSFYYGNGNGFNPNIDLMLTGGVTGFRTYLKTGDFNNDSLPDVAAANEFGPFLLINQGGGNFDIKTVTIGLGHGAQNFAVGDLTLDGFPDVVMGFEDGLIDVFTSNQTDLLAFARSGGTGIYASASAVFIADLNNDQKPDIISMRANGIPLSIYYSDLVVEPVTPASMLSFSNISDSLATIKWTGGSGQGTLAVIKGGAAVGSLPVDGVFYTADVRFSLGPDLGDNSYVVFSDFTDSVRVRNLKPGTTYYVKVFTYNESPENQIINYLTSESAAGNFTTTGMAITGLDPAVGYVPKIYPNPVNDFIIININNDPGGVSELHLFDQLGRESLVEKSSDGYDLVLDMRKLNSGLYILKAMYGDRVLTFKVIKK
jgi:hypothetical protein